MALMSSAEVDKEIIRRAKLTDRTHAVRKVEYMRYYQGFILTRKFMIKTAALLYFFIHFIYIVVIKNYSLEQLNNLDTLICLFLGLGGCGSGILSMEADLEDLENYYESYYNCSFKTIYRGEWHTPLNALKLSAMPFIVTAIVYLMGQPRIAKFMLIVSISRLIGCFLNLILHSLTEYGIMWLYPFSKKRFGIKFVTDEYNQRSFGKVLTGIILFLIFMILFWKSPMFPYVVGQLVK